MKLLKVIPLIVLSLTCFTIQATAQTPPLINDLKIVDSWSYYDDEDAAADGVVKEEPATPGEQSAQEENYDLQPQEEEIPAPEVEASEPAIEAEVEVVPEREYKVVKVELVTPKNAVVYRHEVFAGYGMLSNANLISVASKTMLTLITLGGYVEENMRSTGTVSIGYKYRFDRIISLGGTYAYGALRGDAFINGDYWGRSVINHHSIAVECDFRYLTRKNINVYSTMGLGGMILHQRVAPVNPRDVELSGGGGFLDFQLSIIGLKVGGYRFGGFAELGFGYKGIFNFGAYARF